MAEEMIPAWVEGVLQPVEKLEAHRKGLRHLAISVFVTRGNKVLLQQRALSKYHTPGLWANTCCTHPYWGEDAPTCAARRPGGPTGPGTARPRAEPKPPGGPPGGGLGTEEAPSSGSRRCCRPSPDWG